MRPLTLEEAKTRYIHRYTMDHVPTWARARAANGKFYAPHFRSDQEWYEHTLFKGESELATSKYCYTFGQTWPLGDWLTESYRAQARSSR